jgi:exopolyphosphatase/guanosine-5'-triphosphate,3'-diphosphate pyrophosphatase
MPGMEIAILDLGSTTFHLEHIRVDGAGRFATTVDEKRSLRIGTQVFADGFIAEATWNACLAAVRELLEASDAGKPDHRVVVATSAIRSAANGSDLIAAIERSHGIAVRVLSPHEEARLAYLGQSTSDVVGGRRVAAVDLGGGSVEIAVGEGTRCIHATSLPVGALRVRAQGARAFGRDEARRAAVHVRELIAPALYEVRALTPELVVFGSGSARAARRLLMREAQRAGKTGPIEAASFRAQLNVHLGFTPEALITLEVDPARADSVLAAATIMLEIMDGLCVPHAYVSDKGLRDGVALEVYRELLARGPKASSGFGLRAVGSGL